MSPLLIYVHGFKSSSQSEKAREVYQYLQKYQLQIDFLAPSFSNYPQESFEELCRIITEEQSREREQIGLIGSSLGGFMATCAAQSLNVKAVLINPAVNPGGALGEALLGKHINPYTQEQFLLNEHHLQYLKEIEPGTLRNPRNLRVLLQTGDETLDYRVAQDYYKACDVIVEQGGNHRFLNFDRHLPGLLSFLKLIR